MRYVMYLVISSPNDSPPAHLSSTSRDQNQDQDTNKIEDREQQTDPAEPDESHEPEEALCTQCLKECLVECYDCGRELTIVRALTIRPILPLRCRYAA
jgi:hypothetical protein